MALSMALTEKLSIKHPVLLAPMANLAAEQDRYRRAQAAGDFDTAAVIVGEAVDMVRTVRPAKGILEEMVARAEACLVSAPAFVRPA